MAWEVSCLLYGFTSDSSESTSSQATESIIEEINNSTLLPTKEPVLMVEEDSSSLSTNNLVVEGSSLSPINACSGTTNGALTAARNNPILTKVDLTTTENSRVISESYSTPSETTSVTDQDNLITTEGSSGLVGNSDTLIRDWAPTFWANYIHDLESIWWILIWTLLTYHKTGNDNYTPDTTIETQQRFLAAQKLFHVNDYYLDRLTHLEERESFNEIVEAIPSFFKGLVEVAAVFREKLVLTYLEEEGKSVFPIKLMDDGLLHLDILEAFRISPIEKFDVVHIYTKNKSATKSTTDSDETSESSKRSTCEDSDEERPFKRAR